MGASNIYGVVFYFFCKICFVSIDLIFCPCLRYVESNPQYAESNVYLLKFRQLQVSNVGNVIKVIDLVNENILAFEVFVLFQMLTNLHVCNSLESLV